MALDRWDQEKLTIWKAISSHSLHKITQSIVGSWDDGDELSSHMQAQAIFNVFLQEKLQNQQLDPKARAILLVIQGAIFSKQALLDRFRKESFKENVDKALQCYQDAVRCDEKLTGIVNYRLGDLYEDIYEEKEREKVIQYYETHLQMAIQKQRAVLYFYTKMTKNM